MAEVTPFRGLRYGDTIDMDAVVAPPYDVLTAAQADALLRRSPHNALHVDLPVRPGQERRAAAYASAAATFRRWQADGTLLRDSEPCVYLVDQAYRGPDGRERTRRGFIARLKLADPEDRVVLAHEKTHAGPKMDRLDLYRAAHADVSQIFLLYPDESGAVAAELASAAGEATDGDTRVAHDRDGNTHRITPVRGAHARRLTGLLGDQTLYIADGHHRYETALAYRDERRAAGDHSADTMMVYLCGMSDPGLMVFPTHRLVKGVEVPPMDEVLERLRPAFEVFPERGAGQDACVLLAQNLRGFAGRGTAFGLYFPREAACCTVQLRDPGAADHLLDEGFSPEAARLPVTILHYLIFRDALGIDPASTEDHVDYETDPAEAFRRLSAGGYGLGAFLDSTLVDEVRSIADNGETMPQKSTYFYPKLLTGLVFDALGD
jgi:uncharacterized protein (DUF1015 family)